MPVQCTCSVCGKSFTRRPPGPYCSRACCAMAQRWERPRIVISDDGLSAMIPLHARDGTARAYTAVDAQRAEWVNQWRWHLSTHGYAVRTYYPGGGQRRLRLFLHRELLGLPRIKGAQEVDHRDLDKLNNRSSNLRIVTRSEQMQNVPKRPATSSRYRGVGWDKNRGKWIAYIKTNGKMHNLGRFSDEREAAEVARAARLQLFTHSVE